MQIDWKALFLEMNGRIGRTQFWIGFWAIVGASVVVNLIPVVGWLLGFALIWPQVAIAAKRLHDLGRSAWWLLAPFVISILAFVAAAVVGGAGLLAAMQQGEWSGIWTAAGGLGVAILLVLVAFLTGIAFLLWMGLSQGEPEPNRFGPPPAEP